MPLAKSFRMRHLLFPAPHEASPPTVQVPRPSASPGPQIPALSMAARAQAWQFAAALVFFHGSEYVLAAVFHGRRNVTATSLLISKQYVLAMSFAILEHLTEALLFPELKEYWFVSNVGLLMVLIGEILRKLAVVTAGRAFTHVIRIHHENQHQLITHGVYRFMRHPGYSGFLIWAVGTQVMLCNPVSTVAFVLMLWRFFSKRIPYPSKRIKEQCLSPLCLRFPILRMGPFKASLSMFHHPNMNIFVKEFNILGFVLLLCFFFLVIPSLKSSYEEFFLRQFFGSEYEEYARKVHSGLPFIK